jgi:hypothetical protein
LIVLQSSAILITLENSLFLAEEHGNLFEEKSIKITKYVRIWDALKRILTTSYVLRCLFTWQIIYTFWALQRHLVNEHRTRSVDITQENKNIKGLVPNFPLLYINPEWHLLCKDKNYILTSGINYLSFFIVISCNGNNSAFPPFFFFFWL